MHASVYVLWMEAVNWVSCNQYQLHRFAAARNGLTGSTFSFDRHQRSAHSEHTWEVSADIDSPILRAFRNADSNLQIRLILVVDMFQAAVIKFWKLEDMDVSEWGQKHKTRCHSMWDEFVMFRLSVRWKGWSDIWNWLKIELLYFQYLARCPPEMLGNMSRERMLQMALMREFILWPRVGLTLVRLIWFHPLNQSGFVEFVQ